MVAVTVDVYGGRYNGGLYVRALRIEAYIVTIEIEYNINRTGIINCFGLASRFRSRAKGGTPLALRHRLKSRATLN